MKILLFIDSLKTGGKERQLVELLKRIKEKRQIKAELVVMNQDIHYPEVYDLSIKINYLIRSYKKDIKIFFQLYYLCKTSKPDIIHTWDSMTSFYALPIAKWFKIKLINGSIRNATPLKMFSFDFFLSKLSFPLCDKIISNSIAGLKKYKISAKKGVYIHNGFDFKRITKLKPIKEIKENLGINQKKVIGMVASFTKKKDWCSFIECGKMILSKRDDLIFLAVGDGPLLGKMKLFVGKEMEGKIIFVSNYHPVEEIINIFDVGVLTTDINYHQEGISNSIMEYMALEKPVIATDCGGNRELIIDGETGFLVKDKDVQTVSKLILQLLDNSQLMNLMGSAGSKRIRKYFNIHNMINKYSSLYQRL